jgi:pyridoxal phosphate enzyme (YggS family)
LDNLATRYRKVQDQVSSALAKNHRTSDSLTLVAVSKTRTADEIEALYRLGHRDFGENYVQELVEKSEKLFERGCTSIRWHFIGHLQTNKVKTLIPFTHTIHSVDSVRLAQEISKRATHPIQIYLNVNIDREPSKSGFSPDEISAAASEIKTLPQIDLRGLMCIPEPHDDVEKMREPFQRLNQLEKKCQPATQGSLSMGMSDDFEIAIAEGATAIRVGTLLFGPRKAK